MMQLQGKLQDIFARIPLLISFPTIILTSHYILQYNNNNIDSFNNNIFQFNSILINIFTLPVFLSSSISFILYQFDIIQKTKKDPHSQSLILPVFIFNIVLFQSNWLLKHVLTGCVVLVTLRQLQYNNNQSNFTNIAKTLIPLCLLEFIIQYCLIDSQYNLMISLINIISILRIRFNQNVVQFIESKSIFSNNLIQSIENCILYVMPIISLAGLFIQTTIDPEINLHYFMIIIFLGCTILMTLSVNDIVTNDIEVNQSNNEKVSHTLNCKFFLDIKNNVILIIGIMSIILQFLSFNSNHHHKEHINNNNYTKTNDMVLQLVNLLFIIIAEYSTRSDEKLKSHSQSHNHSQIQSENKTLNELKQKNKSILMQIVTNKDTRSIFSFLLLNATFMFVQLLYSFRSRSLGLLSDSLHMALDCTSLLLGLIARVLSTTSIYQNPDKFPFKLNYLESLAGFTNGILLIGIVCGIFVQALERIINPIHIHGTNELIVVSTLGLLVNLVGLFVFETGHGNGDGHSHDNDDSSNNENMKGIFLHILADTLGSVGVVISTLLIKLTGWHIFDPIASIMIATLILLSSIPLLKLTTETILLKLDTRKHNMVKQVLNQIIQTPGITGYTTPRFWPYTPDKVNHGHSHSHESHSHESHSHESHSHKHEHEHDHSYQEHEHEHIDGKKQILMGYIHIQYVEGENSTIIKKRVEKIFENIGIKAWIQVEPVNGTCWCRQASMANQPISQIVNKQ